MSERALARFFDLLAGIRQTAFPDLFFRGHRSGNPLVLNLADIVVRHIRLRLPEHCLHLERIELLGGTPPGLQNLADDASISTSSVFPGTESLIAQRRVLSDQPQSIGMHTLAQPGEWLMISLAQPQPLSVVRVHNRDDEWAWRAWGVVIELSLDGQRWTEVYNHAARLQSLVTMVEQAALHTDGTPDELRLLRRCGSILAALARGDHANAIAVLDHPDLAAWRAGIRHGFNTQLLAEHRRWWSGHGITRPFRFWSDAEVRVYLERALELLADLRALTPDVCFGFGFVLAYLRDGKMIPHDDDLDLVIAFDRATTATLTQGLAQVEAHLRSLGYSVQGDHFNHRWVFKPGWNAVDVFVGLREPDGISWFPSARRNLATDDVFPPMDVDLFGMPCPVPRNPVRYLDRTYGPRWREADVDFKHPWDRTQFADIA